MIPGVKKILELAKITVRHHGGDALSIAKEVRLVMEQKEMKLLSNHRAMNLIDELLHTHGVQGLADRRGDDILMYCEAGDIYNTTVLYDIKAKGFRIGDYGTWVEQYEKKHTH